MSDSYPEDADGDALRMVAEAGADMARPMVIDFSVDVPNERVAHRVADLVALHGFSAAVSFDEEEKAWSVYCGRSMLATYRGINTVQAQLNRLVAPLGATCDGWGTIGNTQESAVPLSSNNRLERSRG